MAGNIFLLYAGVDPSSVWYTGDLAHGAMVMIGRVANNRLYISGTGISPGFHQIVEEASQRPDVLYRA